MGRWIGLLLFVGFAHMASAPAMACGDGTACQIGERTYHMAVPDAQPRGAVIYLHGWGGNGKGALRSRQMVDGFLAHDFAVVAPDGLPRAGGMGRSWAFHPQSAAGQQADIAFLTAVRDDVMARLDLPQNTLILAGFSIGGSMTAYTACAQPTAFAAYAPLGGHFWRPHPIDCAGPVRMLHTHGWTDTTVPLEGRVVNRVPVTDPDAFAQGDVFHAISLWRRENGCVHLRADRFVTDGPYLRRAWDRCDPGTALELALFPGGHIVPGDWPDLVINWFDTL